MEAPMRVQLKLIPAILIAVLVLFAVACKGGGSGDDSSNQPAGDASGQAASDQGGGDASDELVLSAIEALGRSADDFQQDVSSMQGTMAMDMTIGEWSIGFGGDFAFQSPDRMHMTMDFSGGEGDLIDLSEFGSMEVLLIGEDIYMNMEFLGGEWVKASLDDLGLDADQFRELLSDQSPFDYSALVEGLSDDVQVQDLGTEDLAGRSVHHYRVSSDFLTIMEAMSGAFGDDYAGESFPMDELSGPVVMDLWLDTATFLPYKLTAKGSFVVDEDPIAGVPGTFSFNMSIVIDEYNGDIAFPEPPANAIDMADITNDPFAGFGE
jgi:hypothetical protein